MPVCASRHMLRRLLIISRLLPPRHSCRPGLLDPALPPPLCAPIRLCRLLHIRPRRPLRQDSHARSLHRLLQHCLHRRSLHHCVRGDHWRPVLWRFLDHRRCPVQRPAVLAYSQNNVRMSSKRAVSSAMVIGFGGVGGIIASSECCRR